MTEYTGFSLGDGKGISAAENEQTEKLPMNIDVFYETFIEGNERARDFEEIFKHKTESYIAVGLKPFEDPDEKARTRIKALEKEYLDEAELRWGRTKGDQIPVFQNAIATLLPLFTNEKKYRLMFKPSLVEFTKEKYTEAIRAKCLNGNKIDSIEMVQLLEQAEQIGLVNNENERKEIIAFIKEYAEKNGYTIESFKETFLRSVKERNELDRLDTDKTKNDLFIEYKRLRSFNNEITNNLNEQDEASLFEEMTSLLKENNVLISNIVLFNINFLKSEVEKKGEQYFRVPLNSEYFYYLKGTAINVYQFTEKQWKELCALLSINVDTEATIAFIMGKNKASSIPGIFKLISDNQDMATSRILAGDLETYFSHIGRHDISIKLSQIKEAFGTKPNELVSNVLSFLNKELGIKSLDIEATDKINKNNIESLLASNREIKELVKIVLENKSNEKFINELIKESKSSERIKEQLASKKRKHSYVKFLMNIFNELLMQIDVSQYKSSFLKIGNRVQEILLEENDYISYIFIFYRIVLQAEKKGIISSVSEFPNISENIKMMQLLLAENRSPEIKANKKKSIFGFMKKEE